ncbi:hypothetical protein J0B03_01495 [Alkalibacter rhizosphaerae]|uniref:Imm-5-like domain-containing protein n=1 Tax=Alkalibacter rhizosphaerae TaxID=2815577 RepID=A0A974XI53_9FIRM|nr:hypothetical protein [Alkalibacter rhizosphaerae]QSX08793.1 hypothetical protein J0B03_01495 [Alkalibacter rhizosphaerae]
MPKYRKTLNDLKAPYIKDLMKQIETQSKDTLILWAVQYSKIVMLPIWLKYRPEDERPQNALDSALKWKDKIIKLPEAKKAILSCHQAARESEEIPMAQGVARAMAHSASTIHSARHCIGLALYGALAVAYETLGTDAKWEALEECAAQECGRMLEYLKEISIEKEENPAKIFWKD